MLPNGFHWQEFCDGHRLQFGRRTIAMTALVFEGRCRVTTNPDDKGVRHRFFASYCTGQRYVEAWAHKWEQEIRKRGDQGPRLYLNGLMAQPASGVAPEGGGRSRKRRR